MTQINITLDQKLAQFEESLSDMELIRLRQLRGTDSQGVHLIGKATCEEGVKRLQGITPLSIEERKEINASLKAKLKDFQSSLSENEVTELILTLSGDVGKHQSSFGVSE